MSLSKLSVTITAFLFSILLSSAQTFVMDGNSVVNQTSTDVNYAGAAWVDYDNDGDLDLYATRNHFFINNGDGSFTYNQDLINPLNSAQANGVSWADYNNDGVLDFSLSGSPIDLFMGSGSEFDRITEGVFNPENDFRGWAPAWGDYNNDGYVDLLVTHAVGFHNGGDNACFLFMNNGDGRFTRVEDYGFTRDLDPYTIPTWTDYDLDGDLDLFIGSGPAGSTALDNIFINQLIETGSVGFERLTEGPLGTDLQDGQVYNTIDFDNDGDFDIFLTNYSGTNDKFYLNNSGTYESVTNALTAGNGGHLANNWGDTDNDGDLDVIITSDQGGTRFFHNNGDGTFTQDTDNAFTTSGSARGATFGDYDEDGDLDIFIAGNGPAQGLFRNELDNSNNWVKFNLEGTVSNKVAIGAKVKAKATINGNEVWQMRELLAQNSFGAHNSFVVHFGLGDATTVDELIIEWPSGENTEMTNLAANDTYEITEEIPAGYLRANFGADVVSGYGEASVKFTDLSLVDPSAPISNWEWDFNNDGTIDATVQSPQWTFTEIGTYSVKLIVTNSSGSMSLVREDYIEVLVEPGIPAILSTTPALSDTTIDKSGKVDFIVNAEDPTGYDLTYEWKKNGASVSTSANYNYQSSFILPTPRTDTVKVIVSNPLNSTSQTWYVHVVNDITGIEDESVPTEYQLQQNYPNPFNPSTTIKYAVPEQTFVSLKVYDILGNEVATLVNGEKSIGAYSVNLNAESFASGIYFYKLSAGSFSDTKKMILIK